MTRSSWSISRLRRLTGRRLIGLMERIALMMFPRLQKSLRFTCAEIKRRFDFSNATIRPFTHRTRPLQNKKRIGEENAMGLAAGGRMKQEIYEDVRDPADYLSPIGNRCFVHLCSAAQWELITGQAPPYTPPTADAYSRHGLPWFDYYDEKQFALEGTPKLQDIKSIRQFQVETGKNPLPPLHSLPEGAGPQVIIKYIKE